MTATIVVKFEEKGQCEPQKKTAVEEKAYATD